MISSDRFCIDWFTNFVLIMVNELNIPANYMHLVKIDFASFAIKTTTCVISGRLDGSQARSRLIENRYDHSKVTHLRRDEYVDMCRWI